MLTATRRFSVLLLAIAVLLVVADPTPNVLGQRCPDGDHDCHVHDVPPPLVVKTHENLARRIPRASLTPAFVLAVAGPSLVPSAADEPRRPPRPIALSPPPLRC